MSCIYHGNTGWRTFPLEILIFSYYSFQIDIIYAISKVVLVLIISWGEQSVTLLISVART